MALTAVQTATAAPGLLLCDRCRLALPDTVFNTPEPVACPGCHAPLLVRVFPAFRRPLPAPRTAESIASGEDAACFYHARKKAVVPCRQCGRFLCALCDLEIDGRHLCPGCVEAGRAANDQTALRHGVPLRPRVLHDKIALLVAGLPLFPLLWFFTLLTAPVALFLSIRHWGEPARSPIPRGRWRLVLAGLLALGQLAVWAYVFYHRLFRVYPFAS